MSEHLACFDHLGISRFNIEVDVSNMVFNPKLTSIVECESKDGHPKKHVLKRDWTMCLISVNHSGHNSQHNWRDLYDQLYNNLKNLHFDNE
jgi:hypothetical protein